MKALPKISYSEDVDILMIQLSHKKVDDSYDSGDMIVQVDEKGEPVILEIFNGSKHLEELSKSLSRNIKNQFLAESNVAVPHQIRK